ncbi:response regulator transcription factor [Aquabacterium sp. A7-Y]|uniref:response regulator transcription factor n=1 Tax=Aquabacterium sp. A7-Y TaxID=1349605 RepID=UPI00223DFDF4|nr:response regulator transcription factor [Aquabacterium sp. A7-Y]MCW7539190.1 response regulator transcription factor [Aquabacterium sp. A7-Y]
MPLPTPAPHSVLLVEDDPMIAKTLVMSLRYDGFAVTVASTLQEGLQQLAAHTFELLLLDLGLPDGCGLDLCREVRRRDPDLPILVLTARTAEADAVASIEGGADDYVRKPYGQQELAARMRRLIGRRPSRTRQRACFGDIEMDLPRHALFVQERALHLGKREYLILQLLVRAGGDVVTREQILDALECDRAIYDRTIDSHLSHLRRKLRDAGTAVRIAAVYGVGYRLEAAA